VGPPQQELQVHPEPLLEAWALRLNHAVNRAGLQTGITRVAERGPFRFVPALNPDGSVVVGLGHLENLRPKT